MLWVWLSQPWSSTEQPNPQSPDITSSSRPGPTASPSPSFLPPCWGQGRGSGLAQFRKDHPTHQGLTHSRAGLSGWPHPHIKALLTKEPRGQQGPECPQQATSVRPSLPTKETKTSTTLASTFPEGRKKP